MSHKHKNKQQSSDPQQHVGTPVSNPSAAESVSGQNPDGGHGEPSNWKSKYKDKLAKILRSPEWWMVILTGSLAVFAIASFIVLFLQLEESHADFQIDQRAWIGVKGIEGVRYKVGDKILIPVLLQNTGKTPALHVEASMFVDVLPKGVEPNYDRTAPPESSSSVSPNSEFTMPAGSTDPLDQTTDNDRANRTLWVYGTVTYYDIFNSKSVRRTEVCYYSNIVPPQALMPACKKHGNAT